MPAAFASSANRLKCKLAPGRLASTANTISLLHDFHSAPLSRQPDPAAGQLKGAPLNRRDAMDAEADQALSAEGWSLKRNEFERPLPRSFHHAAISRFARGRRRFNAETRRFAEIRRDSQRVLFLCVSPHCDGGSCSQIATSFREGDEPRNTRKTDFLPVGLPCIPRYVELHITRIMWSS